MRKVCVWGDGMDVFYRAIGAFMLCFFILCLYHKILDKNTQNRVFFPIISSIFAAYMMLTYAHLVEPFRLVGGMLILGISLRWRKIHLNWAALVLSFSFGFIIRFGSLSASFFLALPFNISHFTLLYFVFALASNASAYIIAYKLFKRKGAIPTVDDGEIKGIIFALGAIILIYFGVYHMSLTRLYETNPLFLFSALIILALTAVALVLLIIHLARRRKERLLWESQFTELEGQMLEKDKMIEDADGVNHKYGGVISAIGASHVQLMEELNELKQGAGNAAVKFAHVEGLRKRFELIQQFSVEVGEGFELEALRANLALPERWMLLQTMLEQALRNCSDKGIYLDVQNKAQTWHTLDVSPVKLSGVVGNLLSNAVKELEKTEVASKQITVRFAEPGGVFQLDVVDNAHEFSVEILEKLGQRGNSTNGTGNGYAELWEFLDEGKASFILEEWETGGRGTAKMIRIRFDGKAVRMVESKYRRQRLLAELDGKGLEVV